jgi:hypothetical protein
MPIVARKNYGDIEVYMKTESSQVVVKTMPRLLGDQPLTLFSTGCAQDDSLKSLLTQFYAAFSVPIKPTTQFIAAYSNDMDMYPTSYLFEQLPCPEDPDKFE